MTTTNSNLCSSYSSINNTSNKNNSINLNDSSSKTDIKASSSNITVEATPKNSNISSSSNNNTYKSSNNKNSNISSNNNSFKTWQESIGFFAAQKIISAKISSHAQFFGNAGHNYFIFCCLVPWERTKLEVDYWRKTQILTLYDFHTEFKCLLRMIEIDKVKKRPTS